MTPKKKFYGFSSYNQHDVLKVNLAIWAVLVFLTRHFLALFISGVAHGKGGGGTGIPALAQLVDPIYLPSDLPGLIMIYAAGARVPKAGAAVRWIWANGRWFIAAGAVLFFALAGYDIWQTKRAIGVPDYVDTTIYAVMLAYVFKSQYVKDLFSEFPTRDPSPGSSG